MLKRLRSINIMASAKCFSNLIPAKFIPKGHWFREPILKISSFFLPIIIKCRRRVRSLGLVAFLPTENLEAVEMAPEDSN